MDYCDCELLVELLAYLVFFGGASANFGFVGRFQLKRLSSTGWVARTAAMLNIFLFPLAISPKALFGPFQGMFCEND